MLNNNKVFYISIVFICIFSIFIRLYWAYQQNGLNHDEYAGILYANCNSEFLNDGFNSFLGKVNNVSGKDLLKIVFFGDSEVKDCINDIASLYKNSKDPYISNLYYSILRLSFIRREVIDVKNIIMTGTILNCLFFIVSFIFIYKILKYVFADNREIILGSIFCISLMPSSITFAMFLRPYQMQETFFIVITYLVLYTIYERKYSIINFIIISIIAGIGYIIQFSSIMFVLLLSFMLFINFVISNINKNLLFNGNIISDGLKNILIKIWFCILIILILFVLIFHILGMKYRDSNFNIIKEYAIGEYKYIYGRLEYKSKIFRNSDLYIIDDIKIDNNKVIEHNMHRLGYLNIKSTEDLNINDLIIKYKLSINHRILEIPILILILIFLVIYYKPIYNYNIQIKSVKIIFYYAGTFFTALLVSRILYKNFINSLLNSGGRAGGSLKFNSDLMNYINVIAFNKTLLFFMMLAFIYLIYNRNNIKMIIEKNKFNFLFFIFILGVLFAFIANILAPYNYARYSAVSYILIFFSLPLFLSIIENKKIRIFILSVFMVIYLFNVTNPKRFDFFENKDHDFFKENLHVYCYKELLLYGTMEYVNTDLYYTIFDDVDELKKLLLSNNEEEFYLVLNPEDFQYINSAISQEYDLITSYDKGIMKKLLKFKKHNN